MCHELGMAPDDFHPDDDNGDVIVNEDVEWFFLPHIMAPDQQRVLLGAMRDDDRDKTMSNTVMNHDGVTEPQDQEIASLLRHHLDEDHEGEMSSVSQKTTRTISVPDAGDIHKSTLVSLFNSSSDGQLSKDRLKRVQAHTLDNPSSLAARHCHRLL